MFSKRIINSARFLKMPISTQCLYFHLGLHADDDGVVEAYTVVNSVGASEDDLRVLVAKGFVSVLNEDLVTYINDWCENNKIRADRKIDSIYKDLLLQVLPDVQLQQKRMRADVVKKLSSGQAVDGQWTSSGQPMDGIGKDRSGEVSLVQESGGIEPPAAAPAPAEAPAEEPQRHRHGANGWVLLTDEQYQKLLRDMGPAELERCITYVDESAAISKNKNGWKDWNLVLRKCHREQWGVKAPKQKASEQPEPRKKTFSEILAEKKAGGAL